MFYCELFKIFKNSFFTEHLRTTVSVIWKSFILSLWLYWSFQIRQHSRIKPRPHSSRKDNFEIYFRRRNHRELKNNMKSTRSQAFRNYQFSVIRTFRGACLARKKVKRHFYQFLMNQQEKNQKNYEIFSNTTDPSMCHLVLEKNLSKFV